MYYFILKQDATWLSNWSHFLCTYQVQGARLRVRVSDGKGLVSGERVPPLQGVGRPLHTMANKSAVGGTNSQEHRGDL